AVTLDQKLLRARAEAGSSVRFKCSPAITAFTEFTLALLKCGAEEDSQIVHSLLSP
ncbi:hypothetical protein P7K49_027194, partial [Saguinus oedipus]